MLYHLNSSANHFANPQPSHQQRAPHHPMLFPTLLLLSISLSHLSFFLGNHGWVEEVELSEEPNVAGKGNAERRRKKEVPRKTSHKYISSKSLSHKNKQPKKKKEKKKRAIFDTCQWNQMQLTCLTFFMMKNNREDKLDEGQFSLNPKSPIQWYKWPDKKIDNRNGLFGLLVCWGIFRTMYFTR